jgi:hypothetical protein
MVWKPGQSGNIHGRPRIYQNLPEDPNENRSARNHYRQAAILNEHRTAHLAAMEELDLEDPIQFQHKLLANESLPIGLRATIAAAIAPYYHPKLGVATPSRFIETTVQVPDFTNVEEAEAFLASLAQRFGNSELGSQSALDLSTLVRNWISAKHAAAELELKRLAADNNGAEQVIRIEGGLPDLPGTNIIMPSHEGPAIEADTLLAVEPAKEPAAHDVQRPTDQQPPTSVR